MRLPGSSLGQNGTRRTRLRLSPMRIRGLITTLGVYIANPAAFLVLIFYGVIWMLFQPETLDLHGVATLATWCMTLFIQRAEHRDTQAIHAKLDELLRTDNRARNALIDVDQEEPEEIEEHRHAAREPD